MAGSTSFSGTWSHRLLGILRIVSALLYMEHGTAKLFGVPPMGMGGPVPLASLMGVAGIIETFGGLLLLLGLFTRPVAFILSGEMAVAYFRAHAPQGFWPMLTGGELPALYCFLFLYFSVARGGAFSLDGLRKGPRSGTTG